MPKITMESRKRWEEVIYAIKLHFHAQYGELGDIIPDFLTVGATMNYRADLVTSGTLYTPYATAHPYNLAPGGWFHQQ